jgi:hypothetical protein
MWCSICCCRQAKTRDLGVTAPHRMFSADRHAWVPVAQLHLGENLKTARGIVSVFSITSHPGFHQVFKNIVRNPAKSSNLSRNTYDRGHAAHCF